MSDGFATLNDHGGPLVGSRSHARLACEDGGSTAVAPFLSDDLGAAAAATKNNKNKTMGQSGDFIGINRVKPAAGEGLILTVDARGQTNEFDLSNELTSTG